MDSYETERLIEIQEMPSTVLDWHDGLNLAHEGLTLADAVGYTAVVAGTALPLASAIYNRSDQELATKKLSSRYQHGTTDWSGNKKVSLDPLDLINSKDLVMPKAPHQRNVSRRFQDLSKPTNTPQRTILQHAKNNGIYSNHKFQLKLTNSVVPMDVSNNLCREQEYLDSSKLMTTGEARLTKIQMKLGKQLYPDVITPFLKNLNGHGTVRMQFAGRCISAENQRHTHFQLFRHRFNNNNAYNKGVITTPQPYPADSLPQILTPGNPEPFVPGGGGGTNGWPAQKTSFRDMLSNSTYWSPYNLADLEDCSWNLNALKLSPTTYQVAGATTGQMANVATLSASQHYLKSYLAWNNSLNGSTNTATGRASAPYRYKAVLNKGSVAYSFMNKGTGGAKVDVIVYRMKKNVHTAVQTNLISANASYINEMLTNPIGQGYINTCVAKAGTDQLGGRIPLATDVYVNALYPLLPNFKATSQSKLPFSEVSRQTFAMPSGSRRDLEVILPGEVYDPENVPNINQENVLAQGTIGVLDPHMYGIYISVSGVPSTQELEDGGISYNVGDMVSKADIQFYATYTEHVGACSYKEPSSKNLYSLGGLFDPLSDTTSEATGTFTATPVTMIPQMQAVRTPATTNTATSTGVGVNLTNDFSATPIV